MDSQSNVTPSLFGEIAFDWKAFDFQKAILDDDADRILLACGRQIGKTEMAAIRGLYEAIMKPGSTVLVLSPTQRQSNNLFRRMKYFLGKNAAMPKDKRIPITRGITRETQTVIEFDNGSILYALPVSEDGANIRGLNATLIIVDEAAYVNDRIYAAIRPMLITAQQRFGRPGVLILLSTPNGCNNYFYKAYADRKEGFKVHKFPSSISPLITDEALKREEDTLPSIVFRQEYLAQFIDTVNVVFPMSLLNSVVSQYCPHRADPLPHYKYYFGYDPSRMGGDEAVGIVVEDRQYTVDGKRYFIVDAFESNDVNIDSQLNILRALQSKWRFTKILIDTTGVGGGLFDVLSQEGLPVEAFYFTIKSKPEAYYNAVRMLESKQVVLPPLDKLIKQLSEMQQKKREGSDYIKIQHPDKDGHDDYATAFVLSLWATRTSDVPVIFTKSKRGFFGD